MTGNGSRAWPIIVSSEGEDQEHEDEPLLPSESAEGNVQELPCEDHTVNGVSDTDQEDTVKKALQAYDEFVTGRRKACGMDILYLATPTGEPDRRRTTEYVILDSNGDGIPELHTRTGREFYAFTYRNGQMEILAGFFSHPVQYTLLTDGAFIYREDRGVTCGSCYCKFRLDSNGEEIDKTKFWWIDTNENLIMDENDEYVYNNMDSNGDDVPELHTRGREFYVFTYKNDQMNILEGFFSYPTQYTLLTDGKFAHWEERGDPLWNYFSCFRLDNDGNKIDRINFWWTDTNENCVRDEEDEYIFDDRECTMEEWILKKEVYLYVGDDGWEHFRNEVEWITCCGEKW